MNKIELQLRYRPDDEWLGQLDAVVKSDEFSGKGSAWFDRQQVKETFVLALRAYPLSMTDPPLIEGGFLSKESPASVEKCHIRIAVRPYDSTGILLVQVDLATECLTSPDLDLQQSVTARFLTNYNALEAFAGELEQVLDGKREWALLKSKVD